MYSLIFGLWLACGPKVAPDLVFSPPEEAKETSSGLRYQVIAKGKGKSPEATSRVTVHYQGWLTSGELFDSSFQRGQPATFPLDRVIPGWTEGLQLMQEGAIYRFWIPADLAYGDRPGTPQGMLIFEVELLSVEVLPSIPSLKKVTPHKRAKTTESGLSYKVLKKGTRGDRPTANSMVTVDYTMWLSDGTVADSSVLRGQPATFPLNAVIPGWTEALQLMDVGEKTRFWMPADLAYGNSGNSSYPQGDLIFDIELISFRNP